MKNRILKFGALSMLIINFMTFSMRNELVIEFDSEKPNTLMKKFVNNPSGENLNQLFNLLDLIKESNPEDALTAQGLLQAEIDLIIKKTPEKFAQFEATRLKHYQSKIDQYKRSNIYIKTQDEEKRIARLNDKLPSKDQLDKDILKLDQDLKEATENTEALEKQSANLINIKKQAGLPVSEPLEQENKKISQENRKIQDQISQLEQQIRDTSKPKKKK